VSNGDDLQRRAYAAYSRHLHLRKKEIFLGLPNIVIVISGISPIATIDATGISNPSAAKSLSKMDADAPHSRNRSYEDD
jgi:hypothetical protein